MHIVSFLIVMLLLAVVIGYIWAASHPTIKILAREDRDVLHSMFARVHDSLTKEQIQYVLVGGALLGAVRGRELLMWDDDVDIWCKRVDEIKVRAALQDLGLVLEEKGFGVAAKSPHNDAVFLDVFFVEITDGNYTCIGHPDCARQMIPVHEWEEARLHPLRDYQVRIPKTAEAYLEAQYGADWETRVLARPMHSESRLKGLFHFTWLYVLLADVLRGKKSPSNLW